ncbi:hypothetical protein [Peterkaempfera sp. SMS 1(5)a]|uniref:hypothetical protein n=1 Tax=Peterkaempfera podocarpi TaxID=3232308 RepID=UPI00366B5972
MLHESCPYDPVNPHGAPVWNIPYRRLAPTGELIRSGVVLRAEWPAGSPGAPGADAVPEGTEHDGVVCGLVCVVLAHTLTRGGDAVMKVRAASTGPLRSPDPRTHALPETAEFARRMPLECAGALVELGFGRTDLPMLRAFVFSRLHDVEMFRRRSTSQWGAVDWWGDTWPAEAFTFDEVEALVGAGVGHWRATTLRRAGYRTVEEIVTATPPAIPDSATRIVIKRPHGKEGRTQVTDDPARARAWLAEPPNRWREDLVTADSGPRVLYAAHDYSVWDDDVLLPATEWLDRHALPIDRVGLSPTALRGLQLCVSAVAPLVDAAVWKPLLRATGHHPETVASAHGVHLVRHRFDIPGGQEVLLWESTLGAAGSFAAFADEDAARAHHRKRRAYVSVHGLDTPGAYERWAARYERYGPDEPA